MAVNEGRGMNCYIPIPFRSNVRVEFANGGARSTTLYYQIDYTLQAVPADHGYLHATFRRENPTTMRRDFVIARGFHGPGRFLGCNVGVRIIDQAAWYGEGEVKVFRDGDTELPTICGTGLEDYVGSAWGLGAHCAPYGGAPIVVRPPNPAEAVAPPNPDFVGFYRWHVPDPIVFARELTVTIQQIGANAFRIGEEEQMKAYEQTNPPAGAGWNHDVPAPLLAWTLAERVDDYCATAYVVCTEPQAVPRVDIASALADIERRPYEVPVAGELISETLTGG
jgi:hypothetical protein